MSDSDEGRHVTILGDEDDESYKDESYKDPVSTDDEIDMQYPALQKSIAINPFEIRVPKVHNRRDYVAFPSEFRVSTILAQIQNDGDECYRVKFEDGHESNVPFKTLLNLDNGPEAYSLFDSHANDKIKIKFCDSPLFFDPESSPPDAQDASSDPTTLPPLTSNKESRSSRRLSEKRPIELSSDDETMWTAPKRPRRSNGGKEIRQSTAQIRSRRLVRRTNRQHSISLVLSTDSDSEVDLAERPTPRITRSARDKVKRISLSYKVKQSSEQSNDGTDTESSDDLVVSDLLSHVRSRKKKLGRGGRKGHDVSSEESEQGRVLGSRRSGRTVHQKNTYRVPNDDGIEEVEDFIVVKSSTPRPAQAKENFPTYHKQDEFLLCHSQVCDTCREGGSAAGKGPLVYCQGCSLSYHKICISNRKAREHLVTKVTEDTYVLQCRRCIDKARLKDNTAPRNDRCTNCQIQGSSCAPFKSLKTANAQDSETTIPEALIPPHLLNNAGNILFRCQRCMRAWHFEHLPSRSSLKNQVDESSRKDNLKVYSRDWTCMDCLNFPDKIQSIVAWRPADQSIWEPEAEIADFGEDEREYLLKFEHKSYFQCKWMPGPWVWGLVTHMMRNSFVRKDPLPKCTLEEAVDPEFFRVEIILDLTYTSYVPIGREVEVDLARVKEVSKALVKYRGLTYGDGIVWESPPSPESGELWADFKRAYEDWIHGHYIHLPHKNTNQKRVEKIRNQPFATLEKKSQPRYIEGGTLMDYQIEGMNWLYYKWWKGENAILADEMGLGKTIQIISFLSILCREHKIWPFLIIVPHSTVPNWKREIQRWNPNLRVVAYPGSEEARRLTRKFEMFHSHGRELKCHVVVTSYQTPIDDAATLKAIPWEVMIVDEGQRLKNDSSVLYRTLATFKIKHKVLLTGTPLQNNPRELFNLLQFLDPKEMNANDLERRFGELTKQNVPELHNMIRPYFLRRTKAQVLTMLPPMAEIIVPVTMTSLQTKLYKSILLKDSELIRSILSKGSRVKKTERAKLGNILMQLRIVLCHPFIYNYEIEEQLEDPNVKFRNLIDASAKLQLLEIMLPKLKERGHRALIFSQFLGMLDIIGEFLEGLGLAYTRLDGNVATIERQKRIDAYNAPNSNLFAFLLSTRAGGVGINLATADTVIILDPDYNPHQDLQALSRAHRIGQTKKVLVFHLMTRDTAEEKIVQLGKKKLSLDHLIIDQMGANEDQGVDVESILKFGAAALFDDTAENKIIKYDSSSVDALLDRSQLEATIGDNKEASAETTFSFARVWANDSGKLEDNLLEDREDDIPSETWERILKEREEHNRRESEARALKEQLGRGKRKRAVQSYSNQDALLESSGDDTDFKSPEELEDSDDEDEFLDEKDYAEIQPQQHHNHRVPNFSTESQPQQYHNHRVPNFSTESQPQQYHNHRVPNFSTVYDLAFVPFLYSHHEQENPSAPYPPGYGNHPALKFPNSTALPGSNPINSAPIPNSTALPGSNSINSTSIPNSTTFPGSNSINSARLLPQFPEKSLCIACQDEHIPGKCPLKLMGVEFCSICGMAHFGKGPVCPHFGSETQLKGMLAALRESNEDPSLVTAAKKYVQGRIGQVRKAKREKENLGSQMVRGNDETDKVQENRVVIELN